MRDEIKDNQYFETYIKDLSDEIVDFEKFLLQIIEEKGEAFNGVRSGHKTLRFYHVNKIKALYSKGVAIAEIKELYPRYLECLIKSWKAHDGMDILLDVVSLGILLNIDRIQIEKLTEFLKKEDINDIIIDFLLNELDSDWEIRDNSVRYPLAYELLGNIIMEVNKDRQLELLKQYLDQWYRNNDDSAWYNSHNSKQDTYNGYWSFETGAMVKALGLDDSSLKGRKFYPFDMVHFEG